MAMEIEHKFLVRGDAWRRNCDAGKSMRQGYMGGEAPLSIRVRVSGEEAWLNIKHGLSATVRHEFEYAIPVEDARFLLENACRGPLVEKTRFLLHHGGHVWEIDVFHGDNEGLVVAELELSREGEEFERPDWLGEDVSSDPRYLNQNLAHHPYGRWEQR
jgi:adenylate cyclase